MLKIEHVSKSIGGKKILEDISMELQPGMIHGLIGENGAGKTTLIQCLVGIYKQDEGSIQLDGQGIYENNMAKMKIGYVADRNQYFNHYKVSEMVGLFKEVYPKFSEEKFHTYNETLKLTLNTKVKNLSKGMQMRLALMLNLASRPELLVLDEPTSGLDALAKKQVLDFIIEAAEEEQMMVVISSHHLSEIERICDEITMLSHGKMIYQSSVDELKQRVRKLQVVFKDKVPDNLDKWQEVLKVEHIGSVYYIVTNEYSKALEDKLNEAGAFLIEAIGLNLEEVFIYTSLSEKIQEKQVI